MQCLTFGEYHILVWRSLPPHKQQLPWATIVTRAILEILMRTG